VGRVVVGWGVGGGGEGRAPCRARRALLSVVADRCDHYPYPIEPPKTARTIRPYTHYPVDAS